MIAALGRLELGSPRPPREIFLGIAEFIEGGDLDSLLSQGYSLRNQSVVKF